MDYKLSIQVVQKSGQSTTIPLRSAGPKDILLSSYDLAEIDTGVKNACYLRLGNESHRHIGDHVISIGFPGSSPTGVLYDGFLSARHAQVHHLGVLSEDEKHSIMGNYDVLRVQMPITAGASGAPLIDDNDTVIGVIAEIPYANAQDIVALINTYKSGSGRALMSINGFDPNKMIAELAYSVEELESPGSGFAIPISYLKAKSSRFQRRRSERDIGIFIW
ncbi:MAG: serine protease [Caulobacteraceae bacterium]